MASLITAFTYKKKLKFNTSATGANLVTNQTNFPVCVHINTSSWTTQSERDAFFGTWNVGGKRCQFFDADGTTNLDYEVELYASGTPEAIYWVRVPQVDGNSTADYIWVAFGNDPNGTDQDAKYVPLVAYGSNPILNQQVAEGTLLMDDDGDQCDWWYPYAGTLYYRYANNAGLDNWSSPVSCLSGIIYPYIFKVGSTYYMIAHTPFDYSGHLYLWSSTNKTTWTIMNSGNPVFTQSTDAGSIYRYIWNPGIAVVGDTWHLWVECGTQSDQSNVGIAYSYSTLADMNWDTQRTSSHVITLAVNPAPYYVADRSAILLLHARVNGSYWDVGASYVSLLDSLSQSASYHAAPNFSIHYDNKHTTDPTMAVCGSNFTHPIVMQVYYNQASVYQFYSDSPNLTAFYDYVTVVPAEVWDSNFKAVYHLKDVNDSTVNAATLTNTGSVAFNDGQIGKVADFGNPNSSKHLDIASALALSGNGPVSYEFWFYAAALDASTWRVPLMHIFNSQLAAFYIVVFSDHIYAVRTKQNIGDQAITYTATFTTNTWYHVTFTYDGTNMRLYLNGALVGGPTAASGSGTGTPPANAFKLGWYGHSNPLFYYYYSGLVDEGRTSNSTRSADWIKLEYYSMKKTNFNGDSWLSWDAAIAAFQPFRNYYPHILAH